MTEAALAFRAARAESLPAPKRVGAVQVAAATAELLKHSTAIKWQGEEGPRWQVVVSPAAIRLRRYSPGQYDRDRDREAPYDVVQAVKGMKAGDSLSNNARMTLAPERGKRSTIKEWSGKSRTNMGWVLKTLDYEPLFEGHGIPALVTVTLPRVWEHLAPDPKSFKQLLELFRKRYRYAWGETLCGVWKLEFQRRGAPHLHILMTPPSGRRPGDGLDFPTWLARTWSAVVFKGVDLSDEATRLDKLNHETWGTSIDYSKGLQDAGPASVAAYFSKHGTFSAKDYQNEPPELWREAAKLTGGVRYWGYWVLKKAEGVVDLNPITPHYVNRHGGGDSVMPSQDRLVRRHMRKLSQRMTYVRKVEVTRMVVDYSTGEVRYRKRKVNRRVKWMNDQAGFITVPNGEKSAYELARLLAWANAQQANDGTLTIPVQPSYPPESARLTSAASSPHRGQPG